MTDASRPSRVLARKYRPSSFAELIGQDALVRTLTNAIQSGRLAHAFVLTGVRGVGKTTTARIIAKALNYVGPDGQGQPSIGPFDDCPVCQAIAEDRHPDVLEMDAASHTGVDDVREIIDSVRYGPVSARFKVYIIDEVHMLSRNAFNALLKTLEEPPPHTKFVFATTEIRKVPVTVLSRCQRFDLRRVDQATLTAHYRGIAGAEGIGVAEEALALIARAADGSVRDGLSLLDQAIALASTGTDPVQVDADLVRGMLGLGDRAQMLDLLDAALAGQGPRALEILDAAHAAGADPVVTIQDLLDHVHFACRLRLAPALAQSDQAPETERVRGQALATAYTVPVLTRAWQALLKGLAEVQTAPNPAKALDMVIIRLIHAAGLPTPEDAVRAVAQTVGGAPPVAGSAAVPSGVDRNGGPSAIASPIATPSATPIATPTASAPPAPAPSPGPLAMAQGAAADSDTPGATAEALGPALPDPEGGAAPAPASFVDLVVALEPLDPELAARLQTDIRLVRYAPGRIEFNALPAAPPDLASRLMAALRSHTGQRWGVSVSNEPGAPTLKEQRDAARADALQAAADHPLVRATLETFPGARLTDIVRVFDTPDDGAEAPLDDPDAGLDDDDQPGPPPAFQETPDDEEPW